MSKKNIVLAGAGGKMGLRLTRNLKNSDYDMTYLEVSEVGKQNLAKEGIQVSEMLTVVPDADIIILAVPDRLLNAVSSEILPHAKKNSMVFILDPAAMLAKSLYMRDDLSYFIAHPSHPSVFNWEPTKEASADYFGGSTAKQAVVCALVQGDDGDYQKGEDLARAMYAPVHTCFHITPKEMGLLEPALVETLASTCLTIVREGLDEVVRRGVPYEAAREFLMGHLNIQLAVLFGELPGAVFSDAANKAIVRARPILFKDDWKNIFEDDNVNEQIRDIIQ